MGRAPCCDKANVKKGPWSPEEDAKLKDFIHKYGTGGNWIALPHKAGLKRCGKSCRLRWLNYLRPNIKHGEFSDEEDRIICTLYATIGSRWSIIAAQLPGRTDNDIKNYWNTKLKKKLMSMMLINNNNNNPSSSSSSNQRSSSRLLSSSMVFSPSSSSSSVPPPQQSLSFSGLDGSHHLNFMYDNNGSVGNLSDYDNNHSYSYNTTTFQSSQDQGFMHFGGQNGNLLSFGSNPEIKQEQADDQIGGGGGGGGGNCFQTTKGHFGNFDQEDQMNNLEYDHNQIPSNGYFGNNDVEIVRKLVSSNDNICNRLMLFNDDTKKTRDDYYERGMMMYNCYY